MEPIGVSPKGIEELPSGALRVYVYAGRDPVTKRKHYLKETVPAGPKADKEAEKVRRRLQVPVRSESVERTGGTLRDLPGERVCHFVQDAVGAAAARWRHEYQNRNPGIATRQR